MIKDLYWLILLFIIGLLIYYSNKNISLTEGYKNSIVNIVGSPVSSTHFLNSNEIPFGFLTGYEVGKINNSQDKNHTKYYSGYYPSNEY